MAELIKEGPFKGYYTLPGTLLREQVESDVIIGERGLYDAYRELQLSLEAAAGGGQQVYYKYSPGPGRTIQGFNSSYLPFIDGFYYVRHNPQINLRQQLFALENKLVPASGNTELFNLQLKKVVVPADYCPYYLDPCPEDWCEDCKKKKGGSIESVPLVPELILVTLMRWLLIALLCFIIAAVLVPLFYLTNCFL